MIYKEPYVWILPSLVQWLRRVESQNRAWWAPKGGVTEPKIHTQKRETPPGMSLSGVFGFPKRASMEMQMVDLRGFEAAYANNLWLLGLRAHKIF